MGKQPQKQSNGQQKKPSTNKQRGRPPKYKSPQPSIDQKQQNNNQKQYWFTDNETREIVRILASKCQILFKCLSGQSANKLKNSFWPENQQEVTFNNFKLKRQTFIEEATELQTKLLKKLENHLSIKLIGDKQQMNYFIFGDNTSDEATFDQENSNSKMMLLNPIIHQDFQRTLKNLLELTDQSKCSSQDISVEDDLHDIKRQKHFDLHENFSQDFSGEDNLNFNNKHKQLDQPESTIQDLSAEDDLYDINKHKHFVSWAFVLAWGQEFREHLTKLQNESQTNMPEDESPSNKQGRPENLIQKSNEIMSRKKEELSCHSIDQLIENYQDKYKKEIDDLKNLLKERFTSLKQ
ncbi:unnamed protein product (macronuclear) [Paramecium tetraurelia]|uniref:Uncharacterized protein n=1 Tax=Paramecium tetraurelia TaxID=5888 RepID=A0CU28_PARTE|nr:uncharacterized protein GSPATT00010494001 [Paramecium tetraurelia]CAK74295.1 unnamed protein product [Paramecium tetraurelia]|eukprot:XP_001441692.1 hypothetical protein (macronuclear) [Paramecium tetraurelia strain d4-2]